MRAVWRAIRGHLLSRLRVTEVRLVSLLSTSLRLLLLLLATVDSRRASDAFPLSSSSSSSSSRESIALPNFLCETFLLFSVPTRY